MDVEAVTVLHVGAGATHRALADLATYPAWLGIVLAAEPAPPEEGDAGPAWSVELGARIGPLRRAKRVRMVRTASEPERLVRFERDEHDGREHPAWILTGQLEEPAPGTCRLRMHLHYGGTRLVPVADAVLAREIRRAGARLDRSLRAGRP